MELVYSELHRIASREMRREHGEHTLQTTAVVHEVYLRLCGTAPINWKDRSHFFAVAAQQLRRVLVDHARRVRSEKRGGSLVRFSDALAGLPSGPAVDQSCGLEPGSGTLSGNPPQPFDSAMCGAEAPAQRVRRINPAPPGLWVSASIPTALAEARPPPA